MGRTAKQRFGCLPCFGGGSHNLAIKLSKRISNLKEEYEEEEEEERDFEEEDDDEEERDYREEQENQSSSRINPFSLMKFPEMKKLNSSSSKEFFRNGSERRISAQTFTYWELAAATKNFRSECFLGEGGFGRVYRGTLEKTGQVVAVKQLDRNGLQGNKEFLVEVLILSLINHANLVNLVGYCADGEQRLLVYEFMPFGSLEDHIFDIPHDKEPLDWNTRMKIAAGAACGLEYLHDKANPPVIYRDFKSSNILLDENFHPKLSDFGLAKFGPMGDKSHVSTRVMGTYGYCAPEYALTGQLTVKSDVYSFGVVLLELITGRRAIDYTKPASEQNLNNWARPLFKDRKKFPQMVDPMLHGKYPMRGLYQALAVAAMCLQEQGETRPLIADVVTALTYLSSQTYEAIDYFVARPPSPLYGKKEKNGQKSKKQPPNLSTEDNIAGLDDKPREIQYDKCLDV